MKKNWKVNIFTRANIFPNCEQFLEKCGLFKKTEAKLKTWSLFKFRNNSFKIPTFFKFMNNFFDTKTFFWNSSISFSYEQISKIRTFFECVNKFQNRNFFEICEHFFEQNCKANIFDILKFNFFFEFSNFLEESKKTNYKKIRNFWTKFKQKNIFLNYEHI